MYYPPLSGSGGPDTDLRIVKKGDNFTLHCPLEDPGYPQVFSTRGSGLSACIFQERIRTIHRYFPGRDLGYPQVFSRSGSGLSAGISRIGSGIPRVLSGLSS